MNPSTTNFSMRNHLPTMVRAQSLPQETFSSLCRAWMNQFSHRTHSLNSKVSGKLSTNRTHMCSQLCTERFRLNRVKSLAKASVRTSESSWHSWAAISHWTTTGPSSQVLWPCAATSTLHGTKATIAASVNKWLTGWCRSQASYGLVASSIKKKAL